MTPFWSQVNVISLAQGDFLPQCRVPHFGADFGDAGEEELVRVDTCDLIIVTQSCDLVNLRTGSAALCPIYSLPRFEDANPNYRKKGIWEQVRKGRVEGLHLLGGFLDPTNNRSALVVDFRQIYCLPVEYLAKQAALLGDRWRLQSPFLEHFSQAFARFFMRVGLPSAIPEYR